MQSLFGEAETRDPVRAALAEADVTEACGPWRRISVRAVGGLTAIGFDRATETLLVASVNGQSVLDAATGELIYRNREDDGLDVMALKGTRMDHPAEERFDMAGLYGGGLRHVTNDGWSIEKIGLGRSVACVLHPAGASVHFLRETWAPYDKDTTYHLLSRETEEIRAFGFSWSGQSLALATPSTLTLWHRPAPLTL